MKNCFLILFFTYFFVILVSCNSRNYNSDMQYIEVGANIWHLEKQIEEQLVMADYNGRISMRDIQKNVEIWHFDAGSFVFDLKTGDINRDGKMETALVTAQGELIVLDSQGKKLWSFQSELPLYNVGFGNFTGDEKLEITSGGIDRHVYVFDYIGNLIAKSPKVERLVHRIAMGNLDKDEYDEILVIENRTIANLMKISGDSIRSVWRKPLKVPDERINWENPRGNFFAFSVEIADLDGDGINEIIFGDTFFNKQAVLVTSNEAEPIWISEGLPPFQKVNDSQIEFYSTAFVRCADLFPEYPEKEVISVAGGMFRIWDSKGNLLGSQNAKVGFTDIEVDGKIIYLGSAPNGDEFVYRIKIDEDWQETISNIGFEGLIKEIKENSDELSSMIERYQPVSVPDKVYDLQIGFGSVPTDAKGLEEYKKQIEWFSKKFPYPNLRVIKSMKAIEETPPLDENGEPWSPGRWKVDAINGTMTVEEILQKAKWIEENKIPTIFYIGHSCMPFITLETAEKILQIAPNYCLGFQTSEDENLELIPRYFEHFFKPLSDLCLQYGKRNITKNKGLWWLSSPSIPEVYDAMFQDGRVKVAGTATEDSNSRTPELNLMGRGGLWQAGLLMYNDVSIHGDLFSFNRFQQWEYPRVGHPYLRLLLAHTTMGMTQVNMRIRDIIADNGNYKFNSIGEESTEIYYHLLGKGLVISPDRKDVLGYSPVGIVVHKPQKKWLIDAHNGHSPERWVEDAELHNAIFPHNGNLWGMTNTPEHAFQKVIFNKERQFGYQIPATPFGLVAMVPEFADLEDVAGVVQWWHTDGIYAWKEGGPKLIGNEAAKVILQDFQNAAQKLLFRQVGEPVFMQAIRTDEDKYRLYFVDPGWINPADRDVAVMIQMEGTFTAENVLSGENYPINENVFNVHVPAGLFTIVDIKKGN